MSMMHARQPDDEPTPLRLVPESYYTPARVRRLLEHYHELDARIGVDDDPRVKRHKRPAHDPEKSRITRRADIDRALHRLGQLDHDPAAADAIRAYYGIGPNGERYASEPVNVVADWQGITERGVYLRINRGVRQMAQMLGWVMVSDDD